MKRVYLGENIESSMKAMRGAAAEMRRDALAGLSDDQQTEFVDLLLSIKTNLMSLENYSNGSQSVKKGK